ncbi:hypothetical protein F2Q69_00030363 [Brassica cretica]|uniref:Uncharacterized protein n=1 Tax=Brassica cretica TaxID=69181 RepID=A0A8S9S0C8_BRACR|nr:hypothetical protein F2Q69_00030363 [Brassica cretica]
MCVKVQSKPEWASCSTAHALPKPATKNQAQVSAQSLVYCFLNETLVNSIESDSEAVEGFRFPPRAQGWVLRLRVRSDLIREKERALICDCVLRSLWFVESLLVVVVGFLLVQNVKISTVQMEPTLGKFNMDKFDGLFGPTRRTGELDGAFDPTRLSVSRTVLWVWMIEPYSCFVVPDRLSESWSNLSRRFIV